MSPRGFTKDPPPAPLSLVAGLEDYADILELHEKLYLVGVASAEPDGMGVNGHLQSGESH